MSRYRDVSPNRSLFIKHIPYDTRSDDLRSAFSHYGPVRDVYIPRDFYSRKIRGFAYVEFESIHDAKYAVQNDHYIRGNKLHVEFAQGNPPKEMKLKTRKPRDMDRSHHHRKDRSFSPIDNETSIRRYERHNSSRYSPRYRSRSRSRSPRGYTRSHYRSDKELRKSSRSSPSYRYRKTRSRSRSPKVVYRREREPKPIGYLPLDSYETIFANNLII